MFKMTSTLGGRKSLFLKKHIEVGFSMQYESSNLSMFKTATGYTVII